MLLGTIAELISLGVVVPFLGALTEPERIFEHHLVQPFVSKLNLDSPDQLLLPITILFVFAAVISGVTRLALLWGQIRLGNAVGNDLGSAAYRRVLYQPYAVHAARNSSEIVATLITKLNTVVYSVIIQVLIILTSTFIVLTVIIFMFLVDPSLTTAVFLGFGCLYGAVAYASKKKLALNSRQAAAGQDKVTQVVQEGLGGIRDVLIDGLQEPYSRMYKLKDMRLRRALSNIAIMGGAPRPVIEAFGLALIALLAYVLTLQSEEMAAIPVLGALALAAQRMLPLVQQAYAGWAAMLGGQDSLRDVLTMLEQPLPTTGYMQPIAPLPFEKQISFNNLHFQYSPEAPPILQGINLEIPRGSRIGFIGSTGSGKSTLLDIAMGLLAPTSGTICVDGTKISAANQRAWQTHIAHVPQMIFLADATIAENIAFGIPPENIDRDRVREAAKCAQVAEAIDSWVDGYDTFVGERGIRLSGGQRQRVGIARALYKQADVIVFDEATSALDSNTEHAVMEAINALSPELTLLIVAHRVTTLQECDQIVELNQGRLQRIGSYQKIIGLDG